MIKIVKQDGSIKTMKEIEREAIHLAIAHYRGSFTHAAKALKIGRSTLYRNTQERAGRRRQS